MVGQAELVVTGLDDRGQLVAELQRVAGAFVDVGPTDHSGRGGEELLARPFGVFAGADAR